VNAAQVHGDAVHLALHQQGIFGLADGGARLVQIEQHQALGIKRRLRRVEVFGAGFFACIERAAGEGDHPAALVSDGEHDAFAKTVVDVSQGAVALFFGAEQAAGAQGFVVGHAA